MQITISTFNERTEEIELYYDALKELSDSKYTMDSHKKFFNDDFFKILKSNALLMIYNLVESTILGGILEIYDTIKQENITYNMVSSQIQKIWFSFKFNQVYKKESHYYSYQNKAEEIINSILNNETLALDRKATNISGNLDATKIRQLCQEHGITFSTNQDSKGGIVLSDIKNKRNNLAHGTISFVECGRDYTFDDLVQIKNQTISFLRSILDGMQQYYTEKLYLTH